MFWKLICSSSDPTVRFAAEELKKYLSAMDEAADVLLLEAFRIARPVTDGVVLAVDASLLPAEADPVFDDAVLIDVENGLGRIAGANPRSVLMGVYRFLRELGCAFLRPGKNGEVIPQRPLSDVCVHLAERPSYRHRGVTIEGAVSADHVTDMIDWLPKVGMNSYFIQFLDVPFTFYDRWYSHLGNETMTPSPLQPDEVRAIRFAAVDQIKKRGLLYHAAGHGWTCEPFGIPGNSWDAADIPLTDAQRSCLAEVDGKRELWNGIALNTNLCYSQSAVRSTIAQAVVDYVRAIPQTDVVHLWLADNINNHCECEACRKKLPAEWYVILLNEIDRLMTENGMNQKIVFLLYFDLLWPPKTEMLVNPDRFIMMFAPISRTYSESVASVPVFDETKLPPYVRNHLSVPRSVSENLAWLREWQKQITCDSFDFDYHYYLDHFNDPGYTRMAEVLLQDVKGLKSIGLNGLISCQIQRSWFPTGLGMHLMAAGLWNRETQFGAAAAAYYSAAFGADGASVGEYLRSLSDAFDPRFLRRETGPATEDDFTRLSAVAPIVDGFLPVIRRHACDASLPAAIRQSWQYLTVHADYCRLLADALTTEIRDPAASAAKFDRFCQWLKEQESALAPVLDVHKLLIFFERRQAGRGIIADIPVT